jgi:hypothetical protein
MRPSRELQASPDTQCIEVIMLTGLQDEGLERQVLSSGRQTCSANLRLGRTW